MILIWQSALAVVFSLALQAPVVNVIGPKPQPMIVWPERTSRKDDDEGGGPNGGLRVVRAPGAQKRARGCHIYRI